MDLVTHDLLKFFAMLLKRNGTSSNNSIHRLSYRPHQNMTNSRRLRGAASPSTTATIILDSRQSSGTFSRRTTRLVSNRCCMCIA
jgi:hypothetical protein